MTNFSDNKAPIAFLDSGVGGLPYLEWVRGKLPEENYVYLADRENFPYGPKSADEVFAAVAGGVKKFIAAFDPKLFVLACNTASVNALERLRTEFPGKTFVGTVPAVKPAAERSKNKRIGILATSATVNAKYLDDLVKRFASSCAVTRVSGPDIVDFVEKKLFAATPEERRTVIADAVGRFRAEKVDAVVFACTHFLYLLPDIHAELGRGVQLVDSRVGVGRRVIEIVGGGEAAGTSGKGLGYARMYLSGKEPPEERYGFFAEIFNMEAAGLV